MNNNHVDKDHDDEVEVMLTYNNCCIQVSSISLQLTVTFTVTDAKLIALHHACNVSIE